MAEQGFRLDAVDFDGVYQGSSILKNTDMPVERVPWDIGGPQPAIVRLADDGDLRDEVLDAGCGLGENAIFLAKRGHRVTGIDGAQPALDQARARAAASGAEVTFTKADVTTMEGVGTGFRTVLDSALYHCLSAGQRDAYAEALTRVTTPDARLHVFCFSDEGNDSFGLPLHVSQADLREHLGRHWRIRSIELTDYTTAITRDETSAMGQRLAKVGVDLDAMKVRTDEQGRVLARAWHLVADRA